MGITLEIMVSILQQGWQRHHGRTTADLKQAAKSDRRKLLCRRVENQRWTTEFSGQPARPPISSVN